MGTLRDRFDKTRQQLVEQQEERFDRPNVFAPLRKSAEDVAGQVARSAEETVVQANLASMELEQEAEAQGAVRRHPVPRANRVIAGLIVISLIVSAVQIAAQAFLTFDSLGSFVSGLGSMVGGLTIAYFIVTVLNVAGLVLLIRLDNRRRIYSARLLTRVLIVVLIVCLLLCVAINGIIWLEATYLLQFTCAIAYQVYNDPYMDRSTVFGNPFSKEQSDQDKTYEHDKDKQGYIPLNFFNLFWIFTIASIVGLAMEMVFCALVNHVWEDRAGLVWGPFSPIYGVGALLMTLALNRYWHRSGAIIFVIAGFIGAAFEFFVSWYMEMAFGVIAWSYEGSFLSIQGRTDFAHFLAWGAVGLVWLRLLLPMVLRVVNNIAYKWRATVTVFMFAFMLVNGVVTLLALDCWSQREAGFPVENELQQYFAQHYDDEFMQTRFATMGISQENALRAQENMRS